MVWTISEAVQALERTFPHLSVIVADGDADYLVGTIEDAEHSIFASFQLMLDSCRKMVTDI
jgi:hypothetical protein